MPEPTKERAALRKGIVDVGKRAWNLLSTPLQTGPSTEEMMEDPSKLSMRNVMSSMSSPLDILGGLPGGGVGEIAVMLPFLRGNKLAQAARLARLNLPPGPGNDALQVLKQKYPRTMSHVTEVGTNIPKEIKGSSAALTSGMIQGEGIPAFEIPNRGILGPETPGFEAFKAEINVDPRIAQATPGIAMDSLRHEATHVAQNLANKRGLPSTTGQNFNTMYNKYKQSMKYRDIPYEVTARLGGTRGQIQQILGEERWNRIPPKLRNVVVETLETSPLYQSTRNIRDVQTIAGAPPTSDRLVKELVESLYEGLESGGGLKPLKLNVAANKPGPRKLGRSGWSTAENKPGAKFAHMQDDFAGSEFPMYNIDETGSTVTADTLRRMGIEVPQQITNPRRMLPPARLPLDTGPSSLDKLYQEYLKNPNFTLR